MIEFSPKMDAIINATRWYDGLSYPMRNKIHYRMACEIYAYGYRFPVITCPAARAKNTRLEFDYMPKVFGKDLYVFKSEEDALLAKLAWT